MAHAHHHDHSSGEYYVEQLFTIGLCGAIGFVAVSMWYSNKLAIMLAPRFHPWVLGAGIGLLVLVVLRAIALWNSIPEPAAQPVHDHEHDHGHDHHHHAHDHHHHADDHHHHTHDHAQCDHDHGACGHDHAHDHGHEHAHVHTHGGHDHDHGWAPWRYVVLVLPVVLWGLGLPNEVFRAKAIDPNSYDPSSVAAGKSTGTLENVGFQQLEKASQTPEAREYYSGKRISLVGRFSGENGKQFTLTRFKLNCCAADAVPLNAVILIDPNPKVQGLEPVDKWKNEWIKVTGQVAFLNRKGTNEYMTALIVAPTEDEPLEKLVQKVPPDPNPYANF